MTVTDTDTDPCTGCARLIVDPDPRIPPRCERAAHPGQIGCTRYPPRRGAGIAPPAAPHDGELPPETRRRERNGSRRRG